MLNNYNYSYYCGPLPKIMLGGAKYKPKQSQRIKNKKRKKVKRGR